MNSVSVQLDSIAERGGTPSRPYNLINLVTTSDDVTSPYKKENNALHFKSLLPTFGTNINDCAEFQLKNIITNWHVEPYFLAEEIVIPFNIIVMPGAFACPPFQSGNHGSYPPTLPYYANKLEFYNETFGIDPMHLWLRTREIGPGGEKNLILTYKFSAVFPKGTRLNNSLTNCTILSSAIKSAWRSIENDGVYERVYDKGQPYTDFIFPAYITNKYSAPTIIGEVTTGFNKSIGVICTDFVAMTVKRAAFKYTYSNNNYDTFYFPEVNGIFITVTFDTICSSSEAFTVYQNVNDSTQRWFITDSKSVTIARLLGLPNDLLMSPFLFNMLTVEGGTLVNMKMYPQIWLDTEYENYLKNTYTEREKQLALSRFSYKDTNSITLKIDLLDKPRPECHVLIQTVPMTTLDSYICQILSVNETISESIANNPQIPFVKLVNEYDIKDGTNEFVAYQSGQVLPFAIIKDVPEYRFKEHPQFYKMSNFSRFINPQMLTFDRPDFILDNERLYIMLARSNRYGFNWFNNLQSTLLAILSPLQSNLTGYANEVENVVTEVAYKPIVYFKDTSSLYEGVPAMTEDRIVFPTSTALVFTPSAFFPITWNYSDSYQTLNLMIKFFLSQPLNKLEFFIVNDVGEYPIINTIAPKKATTLLNIDMTVYNKMQGSMGPDGRPIVNSIPFIPYRQTR